MVHWDVGPSSVAVARSVLAPRSVREVGVSDDTIGGAMNPFEEGYGSAERKRTKRWKALAKRLRRSRDSWRKRAKAAEALINPDNGRQVRCGKCGQWALQVCPHLADRWMDVDGAVREVSSAR